MADIHAIQTQRDHDAATLVEQLKIEAASIAEHRKTDLAGFVIVAWSDLNDVSAVTKVWGTRLPKQLVPTFVEEAVRQDILMRSVIAALGAEPDGTGGAA
jgi:hypothetical protein